MGAHQREEGKEEGEEVRMEISAPCIKFKGETRERRRDEENKRSAAAGCASYVRSSRRSNVCRWPRVDAVAAAARPYVRFRVSLTRSLAPREEQQQQEQCIVFTACIFTPARPSNVPHGALTVYRSYWYSTKQCVTVCPLPLPLVSFLVPK